MNTLTCGCKYVDSLIMSFCELHRYPGPESHKDGKGIIIKDLEAKLRKQEARSDNRMKTLEDMIVEFLKDSRVCIAMAGDCVGSNCACLHCRAKHALWFK